MKAIILAGGTGTRLHPLTAELPTPMLSFFERPLLEHILLLLRRNGISEAAVTLCQHSEAVECYFGDGSAYGMDLHWIPETETGTVPSCKEFLGEDRDFLLLSGNILCDFDLRGAIDFHRQRNAVATLLLHRSAGALENLVQTDQEGRVTRFLEKPGWGEVFTDQVSTGISVLSREVLELIPEGESGALSRDIFPQLLAQGKNLLGFVPFGYWQSFKDCGDYLGAVRDVLEEKFRLDWGVPQLRGGIRSGSDLPESTILIPPCYIGEKVSVGENCVIGPYAVLEDGSALGERSVVRESILMGASVDSRAAVTGAILAPGSSVQRGSVLNSGTVLGHGAVVEENAILRHGVKVWPGLRVCAGSRLNASVTSGRAQGRIAFEDDGTISGTAGLDMTPELLVSIGSLLGEDGNAAIGCCGGGAAYSLALAAASGVTASGGTVSLLDSTLPSSAAWVGKRHALPVTLFLLQKEETVTLYLYGRDGLPLSRPRQRKLENALLSGVVRRAPAGQMGQQEVIEGVDSAYLKGAVRESGTGPARSLSVHIPDHGRASTLLREALSTMGMKTDSETGTISLLLSEDGGTLMGRDEAGKAVTSEQLRLLAALLLLEDGEKTLALPASAPAAAERLAEACGGQVLRLGRDDAHARGLASNQTALYDGLFLACRLLRRMGQTGESLAQLIGKLPACCLRRDEVELCGERGHVMQELLRRYPEAESTGEGLRVRMGSGNVLFAPRNRFSAVRVLAEASSMEAAEELCGLALETVRSLDEAE